MQRTYTDFATEIYQAVGGKFYRLLPYTIAGQVYLSDGVDIETRLKVLERGLAANTTTRIVDNIAQRDGLKAVISGDRALVTDASDDPDVAEGSALYMYMPGSGWTLVWQSATQLDMTGLAGSGLAMDSAGRLYVNWQLFPREILNSLIADVAGTGLSFSQGRLDVAFSQLPGEYFANWLAERLGADFVLKNGSYAMRALVASDIPVAALQGRGLVVKDGKFCLNEADFLAENLPATQMAELATRLAGSGISSEGGFLSVNTSSFSAVQKRSFLIPLAGYGLALDNDGRLTVDFSQAPQDSLADYLASHIAAPLHINEDGELAISYGTGQAIAGNADLAALAEAQADAAQGLESLRITVASLNNEQLRQLAHITSLLSYRDESEERIEDLEKGQTGAENRLDTLVDAYGEDHASLADLSARYALDQLNNETRLAALENTASAEAPGLMSASDKSKLDGIEAGAQVNPTLEELGGLAKAGGAMSGDLTITNGSPTLFLDNANDVQKDVPLGGESAISAVRFRDKDKSTVAYLQYIHYQDGNRKLLLQLIGQGAAGWRNLDYNVTPDGYATLSTPTHPYLSENGAVYVDAWWVNQKLGSGASLAALASPLLLNDAAPDALETARKEAIARVNADAQQAIYQGFPWEFEDVPCIIPYSLFDQVNLLGLAQAARENPAGLFPLFCKRMSGEEKMYYLTSTMIREICAYGVTEHKAMILKEAFEKKERIRACASVGEIRAIERE